MLFKFSFSGCLLAYLATVALLLDGSSAQEVTTTTIKSTTSFAPASGVCFSLPVVLLYFLIRYAVMYRTTAKHSNTITCRHLLKCSTFNRCGVFCICLARTIRKKYFYADIFSSTFGQTTTSNTVFTLFLWIFSSPTVRIWSRRRKPRYLYLYA